MDRLSRSRRLSPPCGSSGSPSRSIIPIGSSSRRWTGWRAVLRGDRCEVVFRSSRVQCGRSFLHRMIIGFMACRLARSRPIHFRANQ